MIVRGGRLIDPSRGFDGLQDLRISGGIVTEIGEHLDREANEADIDATGCFVAPGFVDMHVHLREPGNPEKETIATGTEAAVRGGFTTVACMPNTVPALDTPDALDALAAIVKRDARCRVYPIGAITRGRAGHEPCDFPALAHAGAVAFSDDGNTVMNADVLRESAVRARDVGGPFISHCLDERLNGPAAEDTIVVRDLEIAGQTGKAWHVAHLSTRGAVEAVRSARAAGTSATCEVTPHHLFFTDAETHRLGAAANVNPPLRMQEDVAALREAVRDGTIDAFASDHAPHTARDKAGDIRTAAPGFTGLELAVGAYAAAIDGLPLLRFVELLSTSPARILGIPAGTLTLGSMADVTIFADRPWRVDVRLFASKGRTTPFDGMTLPRRVVATVVGGELRYDGRAVTI